MASSFNNPFSSGLGRVGLKRSVHVDGGANATYWKDRSMGCSNWCRDYSGKMLLFRYWSFESTDTTTLNRRVSLILPTRQLEQPEILLTHRFTLHSIFQRLRGTIMKTTTIHQIHSRNRSRSRGMHKKRDHLTKSEQAWTITST
eukprot:scaffold1548_cov237-Alexandrium_tamarense.AAC.14